MERFNILLVAFITVCTLHGQDASTQKTQVLYGESFVKSGVLNNQDANTAYESLQVGDSLSMAFSSKVTNVCRMKGCWMTLRLEGEGEEVLVKFKDYGFFVPTDLNDNEVIVNGKAFIEEVSVEKQHHYAKDAGKNAEAIAKIDSPKRTLRFEATGVLISE